MISLIVVLALFLLILWLASDIVLVIFAGILFAVFLRGSGDWIAEKTGIREPVGLAIFCIGLALISLGFFVFAGAALADQIQKLIDSLPDALDATRGYIDQHDWMKNTIDEIDFKSLIPSGSRATATLSTTFGAFGNFVVILFVGLYGAFSPRTYTSGFVALLAPGLRPRMRSILAEAGAALRDWLKAQFISMAVIGILTWIGLWALGIPLAPILAVLAAILTFIPNIGPILAAIPAVLLGVADSPVTALWIVGLYCAVQGVESYLITPNIQRQAVSLPPALTISVQMLFGVLFGILGLAMATPFAAVALRVGKKFYVEDYLDADTDGRVSDLHGEHARSSIETARRTS